MSHGFYFRSKPIGNSYDLNNMYFSKMIIPNFHQLKYYPLQTFGQSLEKGNNVTFQLLIEFSSRAGSLYEIQYSDKPTEWKLSPTRIRATANRTQWIDRGPPRTDTHPSDKSTRFYRVVEIPEAAAE